VKKMVCLRSSRKHHLCLPRLKEKASKKSGEVADKQRNCEKLEAGQGRGRPGIATYSRVSSQKRRFERKISGEKDETTDSP